MSNKSQVPKGATKKEKCRRCGNLYYSALIGGVLKTTDYCSVCRPDLYEKKKEENK